MKRRLRHIKKSPFVVGAIVRGKFGEKSQWRPGRWPEPEEPVEGSSEGVRVKGGRLLPVEGVDGRDGCDGCDCWGGMAGPGLPPGLAPELPGRTLPMLITGPGLPPPFHWGGRECGGRGAGAHDGG